MSYYQLGDPLTASDILDSNAAYDDFAETYTQQFLNSPDIARNIQNIQQTYPHLTPGATLSAAQAGLNGSSPVVGALAQASAQRRVDKTGNFLSPGETVGSPYANPTKPHNPADLLSIKPSLQPIYSAIPKPIRTPLAHVMSFLGHTVQKGVKNEGNITRYIDAAWNTGLGTLDRIAAQTAADIHQRGLIGGLFPGRTGSPLDYATLNQAYQGSVLQQALPPSLGGEGQSLGSGLFAGGPAKQAADEYARSIYAIDGHAPTMGRVIANVVSEPGTLPFKLLSGFIDFKKVTALDPATLALESSSELRAAKKIFTPGSVSLESLAPKIEKAAAAATTPEEAGLVDALRKTVNDPVARAYYTLDPKGRATVAALRDMDSASAVRTLSGNKFSVAVANDLAHATTDAEVVDILDNNFLHASPDKASIATGLSASVRRAPDDARLLATYPRSNVWNMSNPENIYDQLQAHLRNARMGGEATAYHLDKLASVPLDHPDAIQLRRQVVDEAFDDMALRAAGQVDYDGTMWGGRGKLELGDNVFINDSPTRGKVVSFYEKEVPVTANVEGAPDSYIDRGARVLVPGEDTPREIPFDSLSKFMPYSDARRMMKLSQVQHSMAEQFVNEIADNIPVLQGAEGGKLRDNIVPHMVAELTSPENYIGPDIRALRRQFSDLGRLINNTGPVRLSADALDALRNTWIPLKLSLSVAGSVRSLMYEQAYMAGAGRASLFRHPLTWLATALGKSIPGAEGLPNINALGQAFDSANDVQELLSHAGTANLDRQITSQLTKYRPSDPAFPQKWAEQLADKSTDPLFQRLASAPATPDVLQSTKDWYWQERIPEIRARFDNDETRMPNYLRSRLEADQRVDDAAQTLQHLTQGDSQLASSVASGQFNGMPVLVDTGGNPRVATPFRDYIDSLHQSGANPPWVAAEKPVTSEIKKGLDLRFNRAFNMIWAVPMKKLTGLPLLKDLYWDHIKSVIPLMAPAEQEQLIKDAAEAGMSRPVLRDMAKRVLSGSGDLTREEADIAAMDRAIQQAKSMLYDLHNRSQFGDIVRHFFPFFDAWLYDIAQIGKITYQHPESVRRFSIGVEGLRNSGFFHKVDDPSTGGQKEVYSFPGAEFVTKHTLGVPIGLDMPTSGFQIFGKSPLLPGLGPLPTFAIDKILPSSPSFDDIRSILVPYGGRTELAQTFLPSWLNDAIHAYTDTPQNSRTFAHDVGYAARYLASTGKYDLSNPADQQRIEDDAVKAAKSTSIARTIAALFSPTHPQKEWMAYDGNGQLMSTALMGQQLNQIQMKLRDSGDKNWYDNGIAAFISTFGLQNLLQLQPFTEGNSPRTQSAFNWYRNNPNIVESYPDAAQWVAPSDGKGAPISAYELGLQLGTRKDLSFREWLERANDRVGSMIYYQAKDDAKSHAPNGRLTDAQTEYLRRVDAILQQKFPGYNKEATDPTGTQRTIQQFYDLANTHPDIMTGTQAGRAIMQYLVYRDQVAARASQAGITNWQSAKRMAPNRAWLAGQAQTILRQNPQFQQVFDRIFSREVD